MKSRPDTSLVDALSNPDPQELEKWLIAQGFPHCPDDPVCLASFAEADWIDNCKVMATPAITRYLASGDTLTNHTIDMMECALETAYKVGNGWCIVSIRDGSEDDGDLAVRYFYLLRDV